MAILAHAARHKHWYPKRLKEFQHGDTVLMMLSACQVLFGYIFEQDTLPPSYLKFLLGAGRMSKPVIHSVAHVGRGLPFREGYATYANKIVPGVMKRVVTGQKYPVCGVMHPGQSCGGHYCSFVWNHLIKYSLMMYLPLNLTSVVLFRRKQLVQDPLKLLKKVVTSCVRSASFLSVYCGNAWLAQCVLRSLNMYSGLTSWLAVGVSAGSAVLLEQPNRRIELAIYCMSPALQSFYKCMRKWGYIGKIHHIELLMFGFAMGLIMYFHEKNQKHLNQHYPTLSKIMKGMFGIQ
jgi:hypothetical protein